MAYAKTLIVFALLLGGCASAGTENAGTEGGEEPSPELERCQSVCLQQLCDPLITIEFEGDPSEVCQTWCQDQRETARDNSCHGHFDGLISCLEPLDCDAYIEWRDEDTDAACLAEEATLNDVCSQVEVPRL